MVIRVGGKPVNPPIILKAYLINRSTGKIEVSQGFRNRLPGLLLVKLSTWLFSVSDIYPPNKYKLVVQVDGANDNRISILKNKLRELGITVIEEPIQVYR